MARIILHIGFHKTGTTSIQHFLWRQRERLMRHGIAFYEGLHIPSNHVELHVAAMALERVTPIKVKRNLWGGPDYRRQVEKRLRDFFSAVEAGTYLFSAEGLSYLRYPDEFAWLKSALPWPATILAYLRNRREYAAAYRHMISRIMAESNDPDSVAYMRPDSWLYDYSMRIAAFRTAFGDENVVVHDYDAEKENGNIIPSFLRVLGIENAFTTQECQVFLNRRPNDSGL
jgi:actin-related protein